MSKKHDGHFIALCFLCAEINVKSVREVNCYIEHEINAQYHAFVPCNEFVFLLVPANFLV